MLLAFKCFIIMKLQVNTQINWTLKYCLSDASGQFLWGKGVIMTSLELENSSFSSHISLPKFTGAS